MGQSISILSKVSKGKERRKKGTFYKSSATIHTYTRVRIHTHIYMYYIYMYMLYIYIYTRVYVYYIH